MWRSGVGIDARGNLIYAAANDQTVGSLAEILIRAGAVRAMQLDINSYWVTVQHLRAAARRRSPAALLPGMTRPGDALSVAGRPRLLRRVPALRHSRRAPVDVRIDMLVAVTDHAAERYRQRVRGTL